MGLVWFFLIPPSGSRSTIPAGYTAVDSTEQEGLTHSQDMAADDMTPAAEISDTRPSKSRLTARDKLNLARPLAISYMLPLFVVYFAEVRRRERGS